MEKEFVPYEQALALRKLGLKVDFAFGHYNYSTRKMLDYINERVTKSFFPAPTYSQAFRWFREKYGYFTSPTESDDDISKKYDWLISKNLGESKMFIQFIGYRDSYEEAELECLKKLIEIVKEK